MTNDYSIARLILGALAMFICVNVLGGRLEFSVWDRILLLWAMIGAGIWASELARIPRK